MHPKQPGPPVLMAQLEGPSLVKAVRIQYFHGYGYTHTSRNEGNTQNTHKKHDQWYVSHIYLPPKNIMCRHYFHKTGNNKTNTIFHFPTQSSQKQKKTSQLTFNTYQATWLPIPTSLAVSLLHDDFLARSTQPQRGQPKP